MDRTVALTLLAGQRLASEGARCPTSALPRPHYLGPPAPRINISMSFFWPRCHAVVDVRFICAAPSRQGGRLATFLKLDKLAIHISFFWWR
eukprot:3687969-Prymnesium_polylepis.2